MVLFVVLAEPLQFDAGHSSEGGIWAEGLSQ